MGIFYLLNNHFSSEDFSIFNLVMASVYFLLAISYFYMAYRGDNSEFLEWDDEVLIYKPTQGKIHSYKIDKTPAITVTRNNLIIKAPNAQGTMASLKGYSEKDLEKLRASFRTD
ncbi:hypothetical protein [Christiangramia sediminis]|uniref:Uncharacterized protein n=1 Tax=Christiangramia sediminis TaxID=2881336 RepID=A0A9X1LI26_9FLAO|nr:hypothetical protein [Christiangramia sediminis]MCB7480806.1 hypothetical protein [Christiangramia sediminis]